MPRPLAPAALRRPAVRPPWRLEEAGPNVHRIHFDVPSTRDWEGWALLQSDEHWDNPHCNRALYARHLDLALERRAPVIKYGDLFCAMQGKWDKRANKSALRDEHAARDDYLDALVETAAEWHRPYAAILAVAGPGNHETAILKRHETHLTERFVERLRGLAPGTPLRRGGYSGWVIFKFTFQSSVRESCKLWYHHGYGGGGPVTKGVIQTNRRAVYVAEADIIATGHTHDQWILPIPKLRLTRKLVPFKANQYHVCSPGYKDDYATGEGGWEVERGGPPKPQGAIWIKFTHTRHSGLRWEPQLAD